MRSQSFNVKYRKSFLVIILRTALYALCCVSINTMFYSVKKFIGTWGRLYLAQIQFNKVHNRNITILLSLPTRKSFLLSKVT